MIDSYQLQTEIFNFEFDRTINEIPLSPQYDKLVSGAGEEDDYGIIEYYHDGKLFGTKEIFGGGSEYTELTKYGKSIVAEILIARINYWK